MEKKDLDIKNTLEIIKALGELALFGGKVAKDGKIDAKDLAHLPELVMKYSVMEEAFKDAKVALDEMKDLKQDEVLMLIGALYEAVEKFAEGKK